MATLTQTDVAGMFRPAGALDASNALLPYAGPWEIRHAAHLLRRAGFGGTAAEIERARAMGPAGAIAMLASQGEGGEAPPQPYDPREALRDALANGSFASLDATAKRMLLRSIRRGERASLVDLQRWWLNRMLHSSAPLREKMALYFHGHFTTAAIMKGVTPGMVLRQNQLFRTYALGNLRELTWNVSIDPAMLLYLDNARSDAAHPNENYARELMELFTLGVDRYTEQDVRESARAWTGWVVQRRTGRAQFMPQRHDDGMKTVLGRTGPLTGRDVIEAIFARQDCARFFATGLLNFFVYNDPEPSLVDGVAHLLRVHDFELQPVMTALLRSNVFYSPRAYRALVKSPVEFVVGTYKALELPAIDLPAQRALVQIGQVLFHPPNVAGWPGGANWITSQTMIARQNFVTRAIGAALASRSGFTSGIPMDARAAAQALTQRFLQDDAANAALADVRNYLEGSGTSALGALSPENYDERIRGAAYLTMAMPAYQLS